MEVYPEYQSKLFHVTPYENVASIMEKGLIPNGFCVSLSMNPNSWRQKGMALLEVDIDGIEHDMHTFLPDLDEITVWGIISPERIKFVE